MNTGRLLESKPQSDFVSKADYAAITLQLRRTPRSLLRIAARCACGTPIVVCTSPLLQNGSPFPTFFYLTHPGLIYKISVLESKGEMKTMQEMLDTSVELRMLYAKAHREYIRAREEFGRVDAIADISAGGMPNRVKCLHALAAHSLAAGPGVNPMGDRTLELCEWDFAVCTRNCIDRN